MIHLEPCWPAFELDRLFYSLCLQTSARFDSFETPWFSKFSLLFNFSPYMNTHPPLLSFSPSLNSILMLKDNGEIHRKMKSFLGWSHHLHQSDHSVFARHFHRSTECFSLLLSSTSTFSFFSTDCVWKIMHEAVKRDFFHPMCVWNSLKAKDHFQSQSSPPLYSNLAVRYRRQLEERCVIYGWFILFEKWDPPIVWGGILLNGYGWLKIAFKVKTRNEGTKRGRTNCQVLLTKLTRQWWITINSDLYKFWFILS